MKLQDLLKDIELGKVYTDKDRKPFKVNEDGHTDVPSAIRKLKLSIEDSQELLQKLESMDKESSLPAWWTDKITLASNYLNKSRDYLLNSELDESYGGITSPPPFSSKEAKKVMKDKQHQNYKSKKGMVKLDMQTANLLTQVFKKINPKMKKILSDLGEKNPAQLVATLHAVVK